MQPNKDITLKHSQATLPAPDYLRRFHDAPRFLTLCRECPNFGAIWTCPPYDFTLAEQLKNFRHIHIFATQAFFDDKTRNGRNADSDSTVANTLTKSTAETAALSRRIMHRIRQEQDIRLLHLEKEHAPAMAFFAGSCLLCEPEPCPRRTGFPCRHPEKARLSLEAYGFDISRTASELLGIELQWSNGSVPPEYLTLVSALFTDSPDPIKFP